MLVAGCVALPTLAAEFAIHRQNLHFEYQLKLNEPTHFKRSDALVPANNDFEILEAVVMSNDLGERWAVITLQNRSTGQRLLKNENVVATFADGSQSFAKNLDAVVKGKQKLTQAVLFGYSKFPILTIQN